MFICPIYDIFVNCNWVVTWWQQHSTHLHTTNTQNDTKQTIRRTTQQFKTTQQFRTTQQFKTTQQFMIIIGGILVLFICITRLASNEIFSPSDKINREVGRAKDLSVPLYACPTSRTYSMFRCLICDTSL